MVRYSLDPENPTKCEYPSVCVLACVGMAARMTS